MEPLDLVGKRGQRLRFDGVGAAEEMRARVAHEACHVPEDLDGRPHLVSRRKLGEVRRRVS